MENWRTDPRLEALWLATEIAARLAGCPGPEYVRAAPPPVDVRPIADSQAELDG